MAFIANAWSSVAGLLDAIEAHPFVQGLADGSLPSEKFAYDMAQDALYLADYARMLALASSQAPDADEVLFWAHSAANAVAVERELHGQFVLDLGATSKSSTCTGYTSYLAALGSASAARSMRSRPHPGLPTPRSPARTSEKEALRCNDVPRHLSTVSRNITASG